MDAVASGALLVKIGELARWSYAVGAATVTFTAIAIYSRLGAIFPLPSEEPPLLMMAPQTGFRRYRSYFKLEADASVALAVVGCLVLADREVAALVVVNTSVMAAVVSIRLLAVARYDRETGRLLARHPTRGIVAFIGERDVARAIDAFAGRGAWPGADDESSRQALLTQAQDRLHHDGRYEESAEISRHLFEESGLGVYQYNVARSLARLSRRDEAIASLRIAFEAGAPVDLARSDEDLDSLRGDPDFEALTARARSEGPEQAPG